MLSAVIWRSTLLRLTAVPLALIGFYGATHGGTFDAAIAATGDAIAVRGGDGALNDHRQAAEPLHRSAMAER